jgi:hypothetical protein
MDVTFGVMMMPIVVGMAVRYAGCMQCRMGGIVKMGMLV